MDHAGNQPSGAPPGSGAGPQGGTNPAFQALSGEQNSFVTIITGAPIMIRPFSAAAALASLLATLSPQKAEAQASSRGLTQVGVLRCDVSAGIGVIIGSTRQLACTFQPRRGPLERYQGTIRHTGLDIGATTRGVMLWGVLAPSRLPRFALAGRYVGASAEATLGVGVGANALVGGSNQTITLQPVSVQAQLGVNIALGVGEVTLAPARAARR